MSDSKLRRPLQIAGGCAILAWGILVVVGESFLFRKVFEEPESFLFRKVHREASKARYKVG